MYLKQKIKPEKKKSKRKTALTVSSIHFLALLLLFSFFYLKSCTNHRKPNSIKVNIVSSAQAQPIAEQKVKKRTSKTKTTKTPLKKPAKKKWKALDPSQIRKSTNTVVKQKPQKIKEIDTSEITQNLQNSISKMKFSNPYKTDQSLMDYYDQVSQFLYSRWKQPPRAVANNGVQVVKIVISVDSSGNIKNSYIVDRCGISAIDSSIESLLSALSSLPKPPHGSEKIEIDMVTTPYDF